jgi:Zinc finger C-x8-C-x5-C-x3-H type (and similar)
MNLRQNIDTLEQLITNVEHASDRKFTNKERNQLITIKFADDTRRGHSAIFVATGVSVDDYYERIAKIIQHTDDLADIHSSKSTGKIAAVVAGAPTEKCRAYSKYGNCPRGAACQYLHDPAVTPRNPKDNKDKGKKDWSKNKTPPAAVRPAYTVISKKHRAAVGPARGEISKFNPGGYDDSQVLHIQQL